MICDDSKPVALAGIMGGMNSEITENTTQLLFESAKFMRDNIRKTARSLGQNTDASSHYEKGIAEYTVEIGMARAPSSDRRAWLRRDHSQRIRCERRRTERR